MRRVDGIAMLAAAVAAVVCCAALPTVAVFLGGLTVAGLLGAGAGVGVLAALVVTAVIRSRHRRARPPRAPA